MLTPNEPYLTVFLQRTSNLHLHSTSFFSNFKSDANYFAVVDINDIVGLNILQDAD